MVGRGRVELPTSRLSGVRSNHLSYRPETAPAEAAAAKSKTGDRRPRGSQKRPGHFGDQVNERRKRNEDGVKTAFCFAFPKKGYV